MKLETRQQKNRLIVSLTLVYFVSYITRINYSAVIAEMVSATGLSRTVLGTLLCLACVRPWKKKFAQ